MVLSFSSPQPWQPGLGQTVFTQTKIEKLCSKGGGHYNLPIPRLLGTSVGGPRLLW